MSAPRHAPDSTAPPDPTISHGAPADPDSSPPPPEPPPAGAWARVRRWADRHPLILAWVALSLGMVAILLYTSKDVGLQPSQTFAMVVATVALAGACVWIITWD